MTALHPIRSSHLRSALPTIDHTRTVLQKLPHAADRPVPPAAVVTLSPQATRTSHTDPEAGDMPEAEPPEAQDAAETEESTPAESTSSEPVSSQDQAGMDGLTEAERQMVSELVQRDREVHAHEAAHQAAGGGLVGAASYSYQVGPDGRSYAVGGECPIAIPANGNPAEMIDIAERVRAAALAPASPSGQDLAVANAAVQMAARARQELRQQEAQERQPRAAAPSGQGRPAEANPQSEVRVQESQAATARLGTAGRAMAAYARASAVLV